MTKTSRRGFFARLFGGAAAAVVAPEVAKAAPKWTPETLASEYLASGEPRYASIVGDDGKITIYEYRA